MKKHLAGCSKYKAAERLHRNGQPDSDLFAGLFDNDIRPDLGLMTQDKLCEQVLRIIAEGNLPFSHAENSELVILLKHAYSTLNPPNRRAVAARLKSNVMEEKEKLKQSLAEVDSKISLALDAWTTRNNIAFLGMFYVTGRSPSTTGLRRVPVTICNRKIPKTLQIAFYPVTFLNHR